MFPETRGTLVLFGAMMVVFGVWLIVRPLRRRELPADDSPGGRLVGGLVFIAFGLIVGAVGITLLSRGK